jgi:hypothetical protein
VESLVISSIYRQTLTLSLLLHFQTSSLFNHMNQIGWASVHLPFHLQSPMLSPRHCFTHRPAPSALPVGSRSMAQMAFLQVGSDLLVGDVDVIPNMFKLL